MQVLDKAGPVNCPLEFTYDKVGGSLEHLWIKKPPTFLGQRTLSVDPDKILTDDE